MVTTRTTHAITVSTASPRGKRTRRSSETNGIQQQRDQRGDDEQQQDRPAARRIAATPRIASGSRTSCTQRGSTTGSTRAGGGVSGSGSAVIPGQVCAPGPIASRAMAPGTSILFVGDVVGRTGRQALQAVLPALREELDPTFVVVNGENAAGGIGITPKEADALFAMGADVITLGNHTYRHREIWPYLDEKREIMRPANYLPRPARPRHLHRRARRRHARRRQPQRQPLHAGRQPGARDGRRGAARGLGRRPRAGRHARGGDEREGRDGLVPRRQGDRRGRHAHARPDRRRPRAARRDGLHHRRRHDRRARRRDRRQAASSRSRSCAPTCRCATTRPTRTRGSTRCWCGRRAPRRADSIEQVLRAAPPT